MLSIVVGSRYGKLVVIAPGQADGRRQSRFWLCQCDCGKTVQVKSTDLWYGRQESCGCLRLPIRRKGRRRWSKRTVVLNQFLCPGLTAEG